MSVRSPRFIRLTASSLCCVVALALGVGFISPASASSVSEGFDSRLTPASSAAPAVIDSGDAVVPVTTAHVRSTTVIEKPVAAAYSSSTTGRVTTASTSGSSTKTSSGSTSSSSGSELAQAQSILNRYIAKYPILAGSTVKFGDAKGYQAICYYRSGRIVISPSHTASLERIIAHEVGHILDWRDNGVIDWGEKIPAL